MVIPNQLAEFHLTFFSYIIVIQTISGASLFFFSSFVLRINSLLNCRQSYLCIIEQGWIDLAHT